MLRVEIGEIADRVVPACIDAVVLESNAPLLKRFDLVQIVLQHVVRELYGIVRAGDFADSVGTIEAEVLGFPQALALDKGHKVPLPAAGIAAAQHRGLALAACSRRQPLSGEGLEQQPFSLATRNARRMHHAGKPGAVEEYRFPDPTR